MPLTSNKDLTLFIFEGAKTEEKLVNKLEQNFLGDRHAIKCVFEAEVYQLYESINDEGPFQLDIVSVLKERTSGNADVLKDYTRDSFAYVYLFFDYDAHSTLADDEKIKEMLSFFDNETENGKLYISYPMVEAIRHYKDMESFKERLKPLNDEKQELLDHIKRGSKFVESEECAKILYHEEKMVGFYNKLGELVYSRPIMPQEMQKTMFSINRKTGTES